MWWLTLSKIEETHYFYWSFRSTISSDVQISYQAIDSIFEDFHSFGREKPHVRGVSYPLLFGSRDFEHFPFFCSWNWLSKEVFLEYNLTWKLTVCSTLLQRVRRRQSPLAERNSPKCWVRGDLAPVGKRHYYSRSLVVMAQAVHQSVHLDRNYCCGRSTLYSEIKRFRSFFQRRLTIRMLSIKKFSRFLRSIKLLFS